MKFFKRNKPVEAPSAESGASAPESNPDQDVKAPDTTPTPPDIPPTTYPEQAGFAPGGALTAVPASSPEGGFFSRLFRWLRRSSETKPELVDITEPGPDIQAPLSVPDQLKAPEPEAAPDTGPASPDDSPPTVPPEQAGSVSDEALTAEPAAPTTEDGLLSRMRRGLSRTSDSLFQGLGNLFLGRKEIDADLLEELESRLLMADVGVDATMDIIDSLTQRVSRKELMHPEALQSALREDLLALLKPCQQPLDVLGKKPFVILMVGVNGVGKTTTIGKLAKRYQAEGQSVMLAAGDTFRAAAVEQLQVWGERNSVPVIAQHTGADSASVLYDALQAAKSREVDVLIADTAGRLHNKDNLMEELKKVVRVMAKLDPDAPHEVMLVLDAGTGQNALAQASSFQQVVGVSGISLTKLDGTAKGGVIFAIAKKLQLPIRFIGVGEAADDLRPFDADQFIDALFDPLDNAA
jgi:fused signal recognition particle receptor